MIKFNNLPKEIQERMLDEQVQQGNPRNAEVFEKNTRIDVNKEGFTWDMSADGYDFWKEIIVNGNFAIFYEKYPKEPNKSYSEEEVSNINNNKTTMEKEYVVVTWPDSQELMDKHWYEECVLINEEPLLSMVGSAAYFVPKSRMENLSKGKKQDLK